MDEKTLAVIREIFEARIAFNKHLEMTVDLMSAEKAVISIAMQPQLIGNYRKKILHGGVIASVIDAAGGLVAFLGIADRLNEVPNASLKDDTAGAFAKLGTIDMRVDYLRPGAGESFTCTAYPLRNGRKVAVVRSEFHNNHNELVAVGTGSYIVS